MVVAQLVEWSLPIPEIRGLNPVIGKNLFISNICLPSTVYWKDENKEKETGNGPFFKKNNYLDVRLKSSPICPKSSQKYPPHFYLQIDIFQNSPKVAKIFSDFSEKICWQGLSKMVQSCHSDHNPLCCFSVGHNFKTNCKKEFILKVTNLITSLVPTTALGLYNEH